MALWSPYEERSSLRPPHDRRAPLVLRRRGGHPRSRDQRERHGIHPGERGALQAGAASRRRPPGHDRQPQSHEPGGEERCRLPGLSRVSRREPDVRGPGGGDAPRGDHRRDGDPPGALQHGAGVGRALRHAANLTRPGARLSSPGTTTPAPRRSRSSATGCGRHVMAGLPTWWGGPFESTARRPRSWV